MELGYIQCPQLARGWREGERLADCGEPRWFPAANEGDNATLSSKSIRSTCSLPLSFSILISSRKNNFLLNSLSANGWRHLFEYLSRKNRDLPFVFHFLWMIFLWLGPAAASSWSSWPGHPSRTAEAPIEACEMVFDASLKWVVFSRENFTGLHGTSDILRRGDRGWISREQPQPMHRLCSALVQPTGWLHRACSVLGETTGELLSACQAAHRDAQSQLIVGIWKGRVPKHF